MFFLIFLILAFRINTHAHTFTYTAHHSTVGQNLYIYQTSQTSADTQWLYVIKEWYDEINIAPPVVAQSFDLFNLNIGHFTQMAWASTNRVGCGIVTYDITGQDGENSIFRTAQLYTCNYAPGGNFLGEKMYVDGYPATQCPARYSRSKRFISLCEYTRVKVNKNIIKKKINNKKVRGNSANKKVITKKVTTTITTVKNHAPVIHFAMEPSNSNTDNNFIPSQLSSFKPSTVTIQKPFSYAPQNKPTQSGVSNAGTPQQQQQPHSVTSTSGATFSKRKLFINKINGNIQKHQPTKPPISDRAVTQTSKRVTNWWDKWSINFENQFSKPTKPNNRNIKTNINSTRAPTWKTSNWTWK